MNHVKVAPGSAVLLIVSLIFMFRKGNMIACSTKELSRADITVRKLRSIQGAFLILGVQIFKEV